MADDTPNPPGSSKSTLSFHRLLLIGVFVSQTAWPNNLTNGVNQNSDIQLTAVLDPGQKSGHAEATVRIHANRGTVWSLITSCDESMRVIPSLKLCQVIETAPDHSWQRIHHTLHYSWYLPNVSYEIRATYDAPARVAIDRESGDLKTLHAAWDLLSDGDYTIAHYSVDLDPGFWVPQFLVQSALRRDLPTMLRGVRSRAEMIRQP